MEDGKVASFSNAGTGVWANCELEFVFADYSGRGYKTAQLQRAVLIAKRDLPRGTSVLFGLRL